MSKLKPNVLALALMVAGITIYFGVALIGVLDSVVSEAVLGLVVGTGLGSLAATMNGVSQDPPPPTVPADVHLALMQHERDHKH